MMNIKPIQQISIKPIKKTFVTNMETKQKDSINNIIHNISKYHVKPLSEKWNKILKQTKEFLNENSF